MAETSIEWTHPPGFKGATWNPVVGCRRVSPGCEHCYAETMAGRLARMGQARYLDVVKKDPGGQPRGRWNGQFHEVRAVLDLPLRTKRPTCYFVNSMSDLFGEGVSDEWIAAVFGVMAACPQHRFLILTKRAERMVRWFEWMVDGSLGLPTVPIDRCFLAARNVGVPRLGHPQHSSWPLPNVWLGVSVEDQQRAEERIPHLLRTPAAVRFLSCEPLLGPVDLTHLDADAAGDRDFCQINALTGRHTDMGRPCADVPRIDWVIVGGESGHGARPFDLAWARTIVGQCAAAGVAYFFKQAGAYPVLNDDRLALRDRKGGDLDELRQHAPSVCVREWPEVTRG